MRTLLVLLAAVLSLGAYFSGGTPAREPIQEAERPTCRNSACKQHWPYHERRTPGRDWPAPPPPGHDVNCEVRIIRPGGAR